MARYEEFSIDKGSDISIKLELTEKNGTKKDLSSHTLKGRIKRNYADSAGEATNFYTRIPPGTAADGVCYLELTNTQTKALKSGRHVFDAEINWTGLAGNKIKERVLEGTINITPSVLDSA